MLMNKSGERNTRLKKKNDFTHFLKNLFVYDIHSNNNNNK